MNTRTFSQSRRDELLRLYDEAMTQRRVAAEHGYAASARMLLERARAHERCYRDELPLVAVACCPFDGLPLVRSFDPFGLDGLWWRLDEPRPNPPACPHFCVLRGAVNFGGRPARGGAFETHPGPEVPYVIPRLLEMPTMVAVLGHLELAPGCTAYTIAYFAERTPPAETLVAGWPDTIHHYTTASGEKGWLAERDAWDFELGPWLRSGKLRWCEPGTFNTVLSSAPPESCPYAGLPGRRERLVVRDTDSWSDGLP